MSRAIYKIPKRIDNPWSITLQLSHRALVVISQIQCYWIVIELWSTCSQRNIIYTVVDGVCHIRIGENDEFTVSVHNTETSVILN
jgi:hypothetical protein